MAPSTQQEPPRRDASSTVRVDVPGEWRHDPEPLRRVVQREPDHQERRQRDLVAGGGLTDRETFGEVVQSDADGDQQREPPGR